MAHPRFITSVLVLAMVTSLDARNPVFRSGVDMVPLTVTVTDAAGRFKRGLTETDFAILEDGIPQTLSFFANDRVPLDVALVMDTSSSMGPVLPLLKTAARGLVRTLHEGDRTTIVDVKGLIRAPLPLTDDPASLEKAIEGLTASGSTAMYDGVYIALTAFERDRRDSPAPRRQALVLFSDGLDNASHVTFDAMKDLARRADVTIYTIAFGLNAAATARGVLGKQMFEAAYTMRTLASEAGGRGFTPATAVELPAVYNAIAEELANQYQVGYVPNRPCGDGGFRQVAVRIVPPTSAIARTRMGYVAAPTAVEVAR